jgi:hypothetical protein
MAEGIATKLEPTQRPPETIRVEVSIGPVKKTRCWVTKVTVGGDTFTFWVSDAVAKPGVRRIEAELARLTQANHEPATIITRLCDLGDQLSSLLLQRSSAAEAQQWKSDLNDALAASSGAVIYQLGAPVPIELLAFDRGVQGIGLFERLLGGRPEGWSQNGRRPGKAVGSGAVLFHDHSRDSCRLKQIHTILDRAFPDSFMPHQDLLKHQHGKAQFEIDRLFMSSTASWIHFQCDAIEAVDGESPHRLQLTDGFHAEQRLFREPGPKLAVIMLNACSAGRTGTTFGPGGVLPEGSWAEYFTSDCNVPAVIAPFCPVRDPLTIPFTESFYGELSREPSVFRAFSRARSENMAKNDYTAFAYRFFGPDGLTMPPEARILPREEQLRRAA